MDAWFTATPTQPRLICSHSKIKPLPDSMFVRCAVIGDYLASYSQAQRQQYFQVGLNIVAQSGQVQHWPKIGTYWTCLSETKGRTELIRPLHISVTNLAVWRWSCLLQIATDIFLLSTVGSSWQLLEREEWDSGQHKSQQIVRFPIHHCPK